MRFCNFFVDEMVAKVDGIGIILGIGVINFAHASPVESAQAHRTRLATAINHATFKVEIVHRFARLANSIHFSVGSRVVVERNAIAACSHIFAIFHDVFLKIAYLLCKRERKQSRLPICVVDSRDC